MGSRKTEDKWIYGQVEMALKNSPIGKTPNGLVNIHVSVEGCVFILFVDSTLQLFQSSANVCSNSSDGCSRRYRTQRASSFAAHDTNGLH